MNEPREHDPLIDALLDEAIGGVRPPDLTQKILATYAARKQATGKQANGRYVSDFSNLEIEPPTPLSVLPLSVLPSKPARSIDKAIAADLAESDIEAPPVVAQPRPVRLPIDDQMPERIAKRRSSSLGWVAIAASIAVMAFAASYFSLNRGGPDGHTVAISDSNKDQGETEENNSASAVVSDGSNEGSTGMNG